MFKKKPKTLEARMHKYKKPLTQEDLALLGKLSEKNFSILDESDVREEYIAPILTLLGYEKDSDYQVEREKSSDFKWLLKSVRIG
jgi:hypothetical protein